jgi:hypothetical protein
MNQENFSQKRFKVDSSILASYEAGLSTESQTIIHCKIKAYEIFQQGGWANISPNTYLLNRESNERLKLIYTENIPLAPHRHFFRHPKDCLHFTLLFKKIPETWKTFCLYEETALGDGFFVSEIAKNKSGVYRISIN